jgi:hypothetical protein
VEAEHQQHDGCGQQAMADALVEIPQGGPAGEEAAGERALDDHARDDDAGHEPCELGHGWLATTARSGALSNRVPADHTWISA